MLLDRLTEDQRLFVFACGCRMLGVTRDDAVEGVTPLRKLPGPAGLILTSLRAESGDLLGKKQEEALLGGAYGQLNLYVLGAEDEHGSEVDALSQFRTLFAEAESERVLLFELTDIAVTIILGKRGPGLCGNEDEDELVSLAREGLNRELSQEGTGNVGFVLSFIGRGLSADGQPPSPREVEDLIAPFVQVSAAIIAASAHAVALVGEVSQTGETARKPESIDESKQDSVIARESESPEQASKETP